MSQRTQWIKSGLLMSAVAAAGMPIVSSAQGTEGGEIQSVNNGNISLSVSADVTNEYWFRGISQGSDNTEGVIFQPGADISVDLGSIAVGEEDISFAAYVGTWNSFTSNGGDSGWYESDVYAGVSVGLPMNLSADVAYIVLYGPGGGDEFAQEIDLSLAYDDSQLWNDAGIDGMGFAGLQPYVLFAFETSGASDGSGEEGVYMELGIEPSIVIVESEDYPITLSMPVTFGSSLDDYYVVDGEDEFFGFVSVGFGVGVPLAFIPAEYGEWEAGVGLTFLFLSNHLQDLSEQAGTDDDDIRYIVTAGVSMSY